jgi:MFS family permease
VVGTGWVFLGNAVFTIAVIVGLALMRTGELFRSAPTGRTPGQLREGLRYVKGRADLVLPMVLVFVIGTFGLNYPVTMALLAKEVFGRGAAGYGLFTTAIAVGSLGGALMSTRRTAVPRTRLLLSACFAFGFIEVLVSLMPTYWSTVAMLLPMGAAALTFTIAANSTVQLGSDPAFRGRVMALYMMCFTGGTPIGAPLVGVISDALGARAGVLWSGGISALAALGAAVVVSRRRGVRLRTQVGQVLPHPSLRLRWAATAEPAAPAETGAPAGIAADTELVADRRRAS